MTHVTHSRRHPHTLLAAAAALFALLLLAGAVFAEGLVRIDSEGQVPFYARFGENEIFTDGDWTVIVFYRPPECIPTDFDLNQFFHFPGPAGQGAFDCQPPTMDGYEFWEGEPMSGPAPQQAQLWGRGAVPVWFVDSDAVEGAREDGITIAELESLNPLKGSAANYHEVLRPTQSNDRSLISFNGRGELEDGRAFWIKATYVNGRGSTVIRFE